MARRVLGGALATLTAGVAMAFGMTSTSVVEAAYGAHRISSTLPAAEVSLQVPLVVCHTTYGVVPSQLPRLPRSVVLTAAARLRGRLAAYGDALGILQLVAPAAWTCTASVGADGGATVRVFAPHVRSGSGAPSAEPAEAVTGSELATMTSLDVAARSRNHVSARIDWAGR